MIYSGGVLEEQVEEDYNSSISNKMPSSLLKKTTR